LSYPPPPPPYDPNQPPPPGDPTAAQPPVQKNNKKLILGIIGGLLGLCCVGGIIAAVNGGDDDKPKAAATTGTPAAKKTTGATNAPKAAPAKPVPTEPLADEAPGLGDKVRDGKFEFVVKAVACGKSKVGNQYLNKKAQGQFCQVTVTVKNIGDESQLFDGSSQKALAGNVEFSNDGTAEMYANGDNNTFLNEINPGNQATGKLLFDVPKSTKLTGLELHDSPFSGGVKVTLK
jgi:hypothetical protein